ncbi:MAG: tetraacyldisaccharide 4'-kinase [Brachymonas sp.]
MGWSQRLQRAWYRADGKDWLSLALLDVSWVYGAIVRLRKKLYASGVLHSTRVSVPVMVVGNVIAGGAGKTPVVIEIVRHLQQRGLQPGVVSRGYGRRSREVVQVLDETPLQQSGDEPALIREATQAPVFVGADRAQAAQDLLAAHPQVNVIVCDDGLQHLALQRDIEICVMDERGVGNGRLQPAGPLREPWPRLNENTPQFLLHRGRFSEGFAIERQLATHALKADGSIVSLKDLSGQALIALAGIAQPESFFQMLRDHGVSLQETITLPDHYDFDSNPRKFHAGEVLICTEKDVKKLRQAHWAQGLEILSVPLLVTLPEAFYSGLDSALNEKLSSALAPTA